MYCTKCGSNNSEAATYCRKCGELIEGEVETQVAVRERGAIVGEREGYQPDREERSPLLNKAGNLGDAAEAPIFSIGPTLMFVKMGYVLAAIGAVALVAILSIFPVDAVISIPLALCLFLVPGFYHIRQKLVRYSLTESQIEVDEGLISRTTRNIPIRRIQDVTVATTAVQRLLGFGDVVIDNASEEGGKIVMKNINSPKEYADRLLKQMSRLEN